MAQHGDDPDAIDEVSHRLREALDAAQDGIVSDFEYDVVIRDGEDVRRELTITYTPPDWDYSPENE